MTALHDLIDSLRPNDAPVRSVHSCTFWTLVASRNAGLSTTYRLPICEHGPSPFSVRNAGHLTEMNAIALAELAHSELTIEASIGMAALNSLIDVDEAACTELNAFDVVAEKGAGGNIEVVGSFPFVKKLKDTAKNVWVFELKEREGTLPAEKAAEFLPQCDVVCLTGTSLINHTFEDLMALCRDRFVVLCGPSSPLSPVLFEHGVDVISGSRVTDAEAILRYIREGACFRQVKGHGVQLLSMTRPGAL